MPLEPRGQPTSDRVALYSIHETAYCFARKLMGVVMTKEYKDIEPETGKYYICEGVISDRQPPDIDAMTAHNRGRHRMIIDGPFESEESARGCLQRSDLSKYHSPEIWHCDV